MQDNFGRITLKPRQERRLQAGHLWVFSNEIGAIDDSPGEGSLVEIRSSRDSFVGIGYHNRHSLIAVRLLTRQRQQIDATFLRKRIQAAIAYRRRIYPDRTSFRLIYSEADGLPGLIVDRYGDYLVVQVLTLGMEKLSEIVLPLLVELTGCTGVLLRNDSSFRKLEGLPEQVSVYYSEVPSEVTIDEHGIDYCVSLHSGQKTGYFFDQHENRAIVRRFAQDRSVLDCFCYVGGFAINAAAGGATRVVAVDESGEATRLAALNAEANGQADRIETVTADCFEFLRQRKEEGAEFGLIVLDPPAFVKSGQTLADGLRGYKEINLRAMQLLSPGGVLATFSCSHHLSAEEFLRVLRSAARDARRRFRVAHQLSQAQDHPTLLAMPETAYLKGFVLQLLS